MKKSRFRSVLFFIKELWNRFFDDDITATSAQLTYYLLFSLFPFFLFLVALLPVIGNYVPLYDAIDNALDSLKQFAPSAGINLLRERFQLREITSTNKTTLLWTGLLLAVWFSSRGTDAFRMGLNKIFRLKETRSYPQLIFEEILLTLSIGGGLVLAFTMIVLGGKFGIWLSEKLHFNKIFFLWLRWPVSTILVIFWINVMYYYLPNMKRKFHLIDIGSIIATILWLLISYGFTKYVENFNEYNIVYGSLGSVIILMTWFYLSGIIFLLGAEINAILAQMKQQADVLPVSDEN